MKNGTSSAQIAIKRETHEKIYPSSVICVTTIQYILKDSMDHTNWPLRFQPKTAYWKQFNTVFMGINWSHYTDSLSTV